ncbi:hydrogenase maturation protease, partial [Candidatus Parcubacteria bacterium]
MPFDEGPVQTLVLGIGNILMGDEGVGVHVVRFLEGRTLPDGVVCLDGGTGGFHLLEALQRASRVILIDATLDGAPPGTVRRLQPRFSTDYPRTLTAHDIGLKDLLDSLYLLGSPPEVVLFAVSIPPHQNVGLTLCPEVARIVPAVAEMVLSELTSQSTARRRSS